MSSVCSFERDVYSFSDGKGDWTDYLQESEGGVIHGERIGSLLEQSDLVDDSRDLEFRKVS